VRAARLRPAALWQELFQRIFSEANCRFNTVVMDEACQAVEVASLVPLQYAAAGPYRGRALLRADPCACTARRYGCKQCILIGDPQQLPATVISSGAKHRLYAKAIRAHARAHARTHQHTHAPVHTPAALPTLAVSAKRRRVTCLRFP
jgi:hypothetical protein